MCPSILLDLSNFPQNKSFSFFSTDNKEKKKLFSFDLVEKLSPDPFWPFPACNRKSDVIYEQRLSCTIKSPHNLLKLVKNESGNLKNTFKVLKNFINDLPTAAPWAENISSEIKAFCITLSIFHENFLLLIFFPQTRAIKKVFFIKTQT